jgi:hypothetical protein
MQPITVGVYGLVRQNTVNAGLNLFRDLDVRLRSSVMCCPVWVENYKGPIARLGNQIKCL